MFIHVLLLSISCTLFIHAIEKHPVDVCFMVADLKYNKRDGVKICEIQQGSLSLFNGNSYRNEDEESIHKELVRTLSEYNANGWLVADSLADKNLRSTLAESWHSSKDLVELFSTPEFLMEKNLSAADPYDISTYRGFLYVNWSHLCVVSDFEQHYPGMVVLDRSSFPFWTDKYLMSQLFTEDCVLKKFKPKWGCYKKSYSPNQIQNDLQCDTFVIKPRGECLGKGVIIVPKEELDEVVQYICTKEGPLAERKSAAYSAWKSDPFDSFIVEEFIASDLLTIPHLANKTYQPTMRVAFLLVYNKQSHHVHFLGEYWKTPAVALEDDGDIMQKNKDICKAPYYSAVDERTKQAVHDELAVALPILHRKMIEGSEKISELGCQMAKKSKLQLRLKEQLEL
ncbi:MAG: hypothetical protein JSR37_09250 [Verrucomicrobia bacterium]|nr:hypothetical protein [Verrucomicrobiota bacterium]MBS0636347.1 hypothetical protein [Verrucomicrobiota bacterium]